MQPSRARRCTRGRSSTVILPEYSNMKLMESALRRMFTAPMQNIRKTCRKEGIESVYVSMSYSLWLYKGNAVELQDYWVRTTFPPPNCTKFPSVWVRNPQISVLQINLWSVQSPDHYLNPQSTSQEVDTLLLCYRISSLRHCNASI